jgi:hypothetical protein
MQSTVRCPGCGQPLAISREFAGRAMRCPVCKTVLNTPALLSTVPSPPVVLPASPQLDDIPTVELVDPVALPSERAEDIPTVEAVDSPRADAWNVDELPDTARVPLRRREGSAEKGLAVRLFVERDRTGELRGLLDAEITTEGLFLRLPRGSWRLIRPGSGSRYLGDNCFTLDLGDRSIRVELRIEGYAVNSLAADLSTFLDGGPPVNWSVHSRPLGNLEERLTWGIPYLIVKYLIRAPLIIIPLLVIFSWALAVFGIGWLCLRPLWWESWPRWRRYALSGSLLMTAFVFLPTGCCGLLSYLITHPTPLPNVPSSQWQQVALPHNECVVNMPGPAATRTVTNQNGFAVDVTEFRMNDPYEATFAVCCYPFSIGINPLEQAWSMVGRDVEEYRGWFAGGHDLSAVKETPILLGQLYPGRETHWVGYHPRDRNASDRVPMSTMVTRTFLVRDRVYLVLMAIPRHRPDAPDIMTYLDSFQLVTNPTVGKPGFSPVKPNAQPPDYEGFFLAPGLFHCFTFENDGGEFARDSGGTFGKGTLRNAVWAEGVRGMGLRCKGANSSFDFSSKAQFPQFQPGAITVAGWFATRSPDGAIVSLRDERRGGGLLRLTVENGKLVVTARPPEAPGSDPVHLTGCKVNDGIWHHFAVTRDPKGRLELYVDGVSQGVIEKAGTIALENYPLRTLGNEPGLLENPPASLADFEVFLDEFCVYTNTLNREQINRLAGKPVNQ